MDFGASYSDNFSDGRKIEAFKSESSMDPEAESETETSCSDRSVSWRACEKETTKTTKRRKVRVRFAIVGIAMSRNRGEMEFIGFDGEEI